MSGTTCLFEPPKIKSSIHISHIDSLIGELMKIKAVEWLGDKKAPGMICRFEEVKNGGDE